MKHFNQYIVTKRIKKKTICGEINLPFGTVCFAKGGAICCDQGMICSVTSQDAYDYFTQNDDGKAEKRRKLIEAIFKSLDPSKQDEESYNSKWDKIWKDEICLKHKREDYEDHWLWSYDFYNAEIDALEHIAQLVEAKIAEP